MSNTIKNIGAVELSEQELDNVAGGLALVLGDVNGYASQATNGFSQKDLIIAQQTTAGPNGSSTGSITSLKEVASSAGLNIAIG
ncbi:hypothetical protein H6G33_11615 [Calothrix sp. FACHB-1219]|uniref:CTB family bacteriocin n=1 Tax=unclassified Calothrix TaxID=2619626 RepID=UPI0016884EBA|nr:MULTISPECIES: CTB family bacteriocin [unclassified Calothrix]MBD2202272.1 hypothetical protein [Calothrix sp. FACHB-168]MBD2217678.1 hypothetical protein [Calothrix sp. FACHB-1219]